jgi:simple sugar transport system ATP-binding protein
MTAPDAASAWAVEMRGISKRFGAVQALDAVDFAVRRKELHALVGENGAGKTTLMRILYGALRPDSGQILLDGSPVRFSSAAQGIAAEIGMVSQHYSIIPELTCLQNLMLGAEPSFVIDADAAKFRAEAIAESMGFSFDWDAEASTLSPAGAQKLEILKLLWRNARIMILDEPTAMLSPADSDLLFESLRKLADGGATIILVTHRLPEVMEHCERVTVLREGRGVAALDVAETDGARLAELIVGHAVEPPPDLGEAEFGQPVLEVEGLLAKGQRGEVALERLSFAVRQGEVLGVAGVDGSGQRELFWTLLGAQPALEGSLRLDGRDVTVAPPTERIQAGLRLIPEDRHDEGIVESWSLRENATIGLQRLSPYSRRGLLDPEASRHASQRIAERFKTRHGGLSMAMSSLSGGNQQRFVAARALEANPRLILAFQPARGLDIEATRQVYRGIRAACAEGAAAVVVSYDLDELLENCDRVVAMCRGRLFVPPKGKERDRAAIGRLMVAVE